jgi:hypothetical protein
VNANWVLDTGIYNEWMNQEDYEIDYELYEENGKIKFKKPSNERKVLDDVRLTLSLPMSSN